MKGQLIILLMLGTWLGMILGISFLEAPLKFQAPNITLTLGLGIGKLVFGALNKVEIVFSLMLVSWMFWQNKNLETPQILILSFLISLVAIQSFWLLPILNTRVDALLKGIEVVKSNHHLYFVALEVMKVGLLIYSFTRIYKYE